MRRKDEDSEEENECSERSVDGRGESGVEGMIEEVCRVGFGIEREEVR